MSTRSIVVVETSEVPAALRLAAEHGVRAEEVPRLGVEPVTTATIVIAGTAAAVGLVSRLLDQRKGGQVVDLRPGAPRTIYRTPEVVYGTVVVVAADGTATVEVKEPEGLFGQVLSTLAEMVSGGPDSAEVVARAIEKKFGDDVEVTTR
ncbi:hypothetical protein [Paractinoplanes atraurantiacus]|uniref:Uncharacterized protein n=1 Tax=Paractinoplanes atraurantiacus TaxID=1036182 RepID=A0A285JXK1_9ACTN|nr:hypothetical protein [Actinoplanes atraurantiacus]SNY64006.1 hypothetical protein SAMN05421748_12620 [Actinoplanes atraurantiacus]